MNIFKLKVKYLLTRRGPTVRTAPLKISLRNLTRSNCQECGDLTCGFFEAEISASDKKLFETSAANGCDITDTRFGINDKCSRNVFVFFIFLRYL